MFLRQIAGYALTGDARAECLFSFYGIGGNGKSTFAGALHEILADYAASAAMDTSGVEYEQPLHGPRDAARGAPGHRLRNSRGTSLE